jgi:hypothetical protein
VFYCSWRTSLRHCSCSMSLKINRKRRSKLQKRCNQPKPTRIRNVHHANKRISQRKKIKEPISNPNGMSIMWRESRRVCPHWRRSSGRLKISTKTINDLCWMSFSICSHSFPVHGWAWHAVAHVGWEIYPSTRVFLVYLMYNYRWTYWRPPQCSIQLERLFRDKSADKIQ